MKGIPAEVIRRFYQWSWSNQPLLRRFRLFIKGNPVLLRFYLFSTGVRKANLLPNRRTDLLLTGYPRSGNTFCSSVVKRTYPELNVVSHIHSTALLKLARSYKTPAVVLIRHPHEAVPSNIVKTKYYNGRDDIPLAVIDEYIWFYRYVSRHIHDVYLLEFEEAVAAPGAVVRLVRDVCRRSLPEVSRGSIDKNTAVVEERLRCNKNPVENSNWKNEKKEKMKNQVLKLIEEMPCFQDACALYQAIRQHRVRL